MEGFKPLFTAAAINHQDFCYISGWESCREKYNTTNLCTDHDRL